MTEPQASRKAKRPRVLIVEDVELNRDLLQQLLEDRCELRSANDGVAGLLEARAWQPDLVLLDLSLPKLDGWAVARAIRTDRSLNKTRVVALTAHAMRGDEHVALAAGCDGYLTKPIDEDELFDVVERVVEACR